MAIYFHPTRFEFYHSRIHGPRQIEAPDPSWVRPTRTVPHPAWEGKRPRRGSAPTVVLPDTDAVHPTVLVDNPATKIPPECHELPWSDADHLAFMAGQRAGLLISADAQGLPAWIDGPPTPRDVLDARMRRRRGELLAQSDWTELPSAQERLSETQRQAWASYRQALRDIPANTPDLSVVVWPASPDGVGA